MEANKLKKQKNTHFSILFMLFVILIVFLFYIAYLFVNNQLHFEEGFVIFPIIIIASSTIPLSQIKRINKKLKS